MTRLSPVEKTTRYSTMVESLSEAFAFVMEHLDELGEESPPGFYHPDQHSQ